MPGESQSEIEKRLEILETFVKDLRRYSRVSNEQELSNLRSKINRNKRAVRQLVVEAGCLKTFGVAPPPAVGGFMQSNIDPFTALFQTYYGHSFHTAIIDMIEEAIGVIQSPEYLQRISASEVEVKRDAPAQDTDQVLKPSTAKPVTTKGPAMPNDLARPRLFIGSSREGLPIAEAIHASLEHDLECTIWNQGVFGLSLATLETLEKQLHSADFAVLIVTPDDMTESRGATTASARDNVIFELGLFMGALGRARTFVVRPRRSAVKMPSDLSGITMALYDDQRSDDNLRAAVSSACSDIKAAIREARKKESESSV